jgi:hypothetical protein
MRDRGFRGPNDPIQIEKAAHDFGIVPTDDRAAQKFGLGNPSQAECYFRLVKQEPLLRTVLPVPPKADQKISI